MATVRVTPEAWESLSKLQPDIRLRIVELFRRLERWPAVSGARPLGWSLARRWRLRTGDYRVPFRVEGAEVIVEKLGHRDGFYER